MLMKKFLMIVCMMLASTAMFAQQGSTYVGANLNYGMDSNYKNFGIGAKVQYEFITSVRAEASFDYFLKKDHISEWDVNLNAQYLLRVGDLCIYPLAGITMLTICPEGLDSDSKIGFNAGAGIEYPISGGIKVNAEFKYQYVKDADRPVLSVGVAFPL